MINLRFVGQFDKKGEMMFGYHAQWREDRKSCDLKEEARKIANLNNPANRDRYPRFFTWVKKYTHEEKKSLGRKEGDETIILAGYQGQLDKEEVFI